MKKEILVDEREYRPKSCSLFSIIVVIFHHILICSLISFQVYGILIETDLIQNYFSIGDQLRIWLIISFFLGMNVSTPIAEYILRKFTNIQVVFSLTIFYSILSFIQGSISDVYLFTFIRFIAGIVAGALWLFSKFLLDEYIEDRWGKETARFLRMYLQMIGFAISALIVGLFCKQMDVGSLFFIDGFIGLFAAFLMIIFFKKVPTWEGTCLKPDFIGYFLFLFFLFSLRFYLTNLTMPMNPEHQYSLSSKLSLGAVMTAFVLFIVRCSVSQNPLVNVYFFKKIEFSLAAIVVFMTRAVLFGPLFVITPILRNIYGYDHFTIGKIFALFAICIFLSGIVTRCFENKNKILLLFGLILLILPSFFYELSKETTLAQIYLLFGLKGGGIGLCLNPVTRFRKKDVDGTKEEFDSIMSCISFFSAAVTGAVLYTIIFFTSRIYHQRIIENLSVNVEFRSFDVSSLSYYIDQLSFLHGYNDAMLCYAFVNSITGALLVYYMIKREQEKKRSLSTT